MAKKGIYRSKYTGQEMDDILEKGESLVSISIIKDNDSLDEIKVPSKKEDTNISEEELIGGLKLSETEEITAAALYDLNERVETLETNNTSSESSSSLSVTKITWSELKDLRDNNLLIPNSYYLITDYITVVPEGTDYSDYVKSVGHLFDIIVKAVSTDYLSEEALATWHSYSEDDYFYNSSLNQWKIWYHLDNDNNHDYSITCTSRYWSDETLDVSISYYNSNGTGYIYKMIDEYDNEASYDFKNLQFLLGLVSSIQGASDLSINNCVASYNYGILNIDNDPVTYWCYTFTDNLTDLNDNSLVGASYNNKLNGNTYVNVFLGSCYDNIIETNSFYNTFSNSYQITLGTESFCNLIYLSSYSNFDAVFYNNVINNIYYNKIGKNSCGNILSETATNIAGNCFCENILINTSDNIFANYCYENILGGCSEITMDSYCKNIIINEGYDNNFRGHNYNITLENGIYCSNFNGCADLTISKASDLSGDIQYLNILSGDYNELTLEINEVYNSQRNVGLDSDGNIKIWNPVD